MNTQTLGVNNALFSIVFSSLQHLPDLYFTRTNYPTLHILIRHEKVKSVKVDGNGGE